MRTQVLSIALLIGIFGCNSDTLLEAQRQHGHAQSAVTGTYTIPISGYVGPCCVTRFLGSLAIIRVTQNATGDSLFVDGTLMGSGIQPTPIEHLATQIFGGSTGRCSHLIFHFSGTVEVGLSDPLTRLQTPTDQPSPLAPSRAWCDAAAAVGRDIRKLEQALVSINASLGG